MIISKRILIFGPFLAGVFLLASCGTAAPATPTIDANAIITQVAQTVEAGLALTQAALPSSTPTNTPPPTPTSTATHAVTPTTFTVNIATSQPILPGTVGPDEYHFVQDVTVSDGTVVGPGDVLDKTWEIKNIGTSFWNTSYRLFYCSGLSNDLVPKVFPKLFYNIPAEVDPAESLKLTFTFVAPTAVGHYKIFFQLLTDKGNQVVDDSEAHYGCGLWADFTVAKP